MAEKEGDAESISERDFANQILLYAGVSDKKRVSVCRRIRKEFKNSKKVCVISIIIVNIGLFAMLGSCKTVY